MNPEFATRLAGAIRQANAQGLHLGVMSGYRDDATTGSKYDAGGNSAHGYGLASDISGLDGPNGKITQQWAGIAKANGLNNPYGVGNKAEFNHWQLPAQPLEKTPQLLANLKTARATGDWNGVWAAYNNSPVAGTQFAGPGASGTRINAASAPVAGALAKQEVGPENAGASVPAAASSGPLDVRQLVFNKLTGAGLKPNQALGAVWSLAGESGAGLNPNAYNPKDPGGSVGIGQWQGPRRAALEAFAKDRGTAVTDPNTQADFLVDELTNEKAATYQPGVFKSLQGADTAADATKIWTSQFERPTVDNSAARIKNGTNVASLDSDGNFVLGSATGAAPSTSSAPAVAAAPDKPWWQKAFDAPTDAQGNPTGAKSPLQQAVSAFSGQDKGSSLQQFRQAQEDEAPQGQVRNQAGPAPGARNVSPMGGAFLPSVPQTYGQTINSLSAPLTWNSAPPRAPQTPAAGLQGSPGSQIPGMSLTSFQAPQGIGYGVDPNIGYGYG